MVKWLNVGMDDALKISLDKYIKDQGFKSYTAYFKHLTGFDSKENIKQLESKNDIPKIIALDEHPNKIISEDDLPTKQDLMNNWTKYIEQDDWDEGMVKAVNDLKYIKKEEFPGKIEQIQIEMKRTSYTDDDIKKVIDKSKELKQLYIELNVKKK